MPTPDDEGQLLKWQDFPPSLLREMLVLVAVDLGIQDRDKQEKLRLFVMKTYRAGFQLGEAAFSPKL